VLATTGNVDQAVTASIADYRRPPPWIATPEDTLAWAIERETVAGLIYGYAWRWGDEQPETVASEIRFDLPLRLPSGRNSRTFRLAGRIDKIIRMPGGRLAIRETKTTGEDVGPDSDYWSQLRIDQQISIYMLAAREVGYDVQTVEYDCLRKPLIRPSKLSKTELLGIEQGHYRERSCPPTVPPDGRETPELWAMRLQSEIQSKPDWYYARREIPRLESDLAETREELWQQAQMLRDCQRRCAWPRNTGACLRPYRCPVWELCCSGISPDQDPLPSGYERVRNVHPELSEEAN